MRTIDQLIADAPLFAGLDPGQLELLAGCGRNTHIGPGELVLREGDPADRFFLIRRGSVMLEVHAPGRPALQIESLHEGDVVGWSWLFAPYRWQLDARTTQATELIVFDAVCLRDKCDTDHELGYELMRRFASSLVRRLQATRLQLLDVYGNGGPGS